MALADLVRGHLIEVWREAVKLVDERTFEIFGLTDAAVGALAKSVDVVLTDDLALYDYLGRAGMSVVNFTHLRQANWNLGR